MKSEVKATQKIAEDGQHSPVELFLREDGVLEIHSFCEWGKASFVLSDKQVSDLFLFILEKTFCSISVPDNAVGKKPPPTAKDVFGHIPTKDMKFSEEAMKMIEEQRKKSNLTWFNEIQSSTNYTGIPATKYGLSPIVSVASILETKEELERMRYMMFSQNAMPFEEIQEKSNSQLIEEIKTKLDEQYNKPNKVPSWLNSYTPSPLPNSLEIQSEKAERIIKPPQKEITYKMGGSPDCLLISIPTSDVEPKKVINAGNPFEKDWSK